MRTFQSRDTFVIQGRGRVFTGRWDYSDLPKIGETILLDGEEKVVRSIESFTRWCHKGKPIGILIEE